MSCPVNSPALGGEFFEDRIGGGCPGERASLVERWPFDKPQFLILNIAVGGGLGGAVDDAVFPVSMEVEHVRVYRAPPP